MPYHAIGIVGIQQLASQHVRKLGLMAFNAWLQQRMVERGMSQADLARATGRSTNIVSLWCRGIKQPGVRSVPRLALALGAAEADVFRALTGAETPEPPGDVIAALKQRIPEVPLSPSEIRLLCDMVEAFVWTIHRWGRHEQYLEEEIQRRLLNDGLAAIGSNDADGPSRAVRGG
jgi:transcriptional regulator with XRE-family HTH domain